MESSIAVFLLRQPACERLPTNDSATATSYKNWTPGRNCAKLQTRDRQPNTKPGGQQYNNLQTYLASVGRRSSSSLS